MSTLFVGLGNPGREYAQTRHNIGFMLCDLLADHFRLNWKDKFKGEFAPFSQDGEQNVLLKPMTYMNLSGESTVPCGQFFKIDRPAWLVIHDELDLPYGQLAFKKGGGLAGHNGLKSIAKLSGGQDFMRLRLGIGRPQYGDVSNHVLSPFSEDEEAVLPDFLKLGMDAILSYLDVGLDKASNKFGRKKIKLNNE